MPLHIDDFPLTSIDSRIYGKTQNSPVLTANDSQTAQLVVQLLNERHSLQARFHQENNQPLAVIFDSSVISVSRTG